MIKCLVSLKSGLQVAGIDVAGVNTIDSAFSFQVVGNIDYKELIEGIDKLCEQCDNVETYYDTDQAKCGSITLHKMSGRNISAIVNNCRVLYHGDVSCWKAISKAITKELNKEK